MVRVAGYASEVVDYWAQQGRWTFETTEFPVSRDSARSSARTVIATLLSDATGTCGKWGTCKLSDTEQYVGEVDRCDGKVVCKGVGLCVTRENGALVQFCQGVFRENTAVCLTHDKDAPGEFLKRVSREGQYSVWHSDMPHEVRIGCNVDGL